MPQTIELMVGAAHAVPVSPEGGTVTATVDQTGGTVYYADNPQVSAASNQGSIAPGATATLGAPVWLIASATAGVTLVITSIYDEWAADPPGSGENGSSLVTVQGASGTNLGAAQTIDFAGTEQEIWLVGTLSANLTVTVSNRVAGCRALLLITQDATGGRTLTVTDGSSPQSVAVSSAASTLSVAEVKCPDATAIDAIAVSDDSGADWVAADHGLLSWSFDPSVAGVSGTITAGQLYVVRLHLPTPVNIANVWLGISSSGSTLTAGEAFAGAYTAAGALIGSTADQSTNWTSTGTKGMALTPQSAGSLTGVSGDVYVAFYVGGGTTMPKFVCGASLLGASVNLSSSAPRYGKADTGLTTALPTTLGAMSSLVTSFWAALS